MSDKCVHCADHEKITTDVSGNKATVKLAVVVLIAIIAYLSARYDSLAGTVEQLKKENTSTNLLVQELGLNLKNLMEAKGVTYIPLNKGAK